MKYKDARNDSFFKAVTEDLSDGDKVLFIGFARRDESDRNEVYERDKKLILAQTDKNIEVVNATYDNLIQQAKEAKAIFVTGGKTPELVEDIWKYPDFFDVIKGKTMAGSSAGACLFSTHYFYSEEEGVLEGLQILPIRLMVHYGNPEYNSTAEYLKLLEVYPNDLELVTLQECEWTVHELET